MRTFLALGLFLLTAVTTLGCTGSSLSDDDVTRVCNLQVRCGGGFVTQESCEAAIRASRQDAASRGCANQFGAAGRCAIRTDECGGTSSMCASHAAALESCLGRTSSDSGGIIILVDSGIPTTASPLRRGADGVLEIQHDGVWLPICDDGFGMEEATVACRQLGLTGATSYTTITGVSEAFWLDDVVCTGGETSLDQCSHSGWGTENCSGSETQAVECF